MKYTSLIRGLVSFSISSVLAATRAYGYSGMPWEPRPSVLVRIVTSQATIPGAIVGTIVAGGWLLFVGVDDNRSRVLLRVAIGVLIALCALSVAMRLLGSAAE